MKKRQPSSDGECIHKQLRTNAAFLALGDLASFQSGGCWIAARAIQRQFGGKLVVVASSRNAAEHVVVERDGLYYDSDGAQTEQQLLRKLAVEEGVPAPRIAPYRRKLLGEIPVDEKKARQVQALLGRCPRPR